MAKRARQTRSSNAILFLSVAIALAFALFKTRENSRLAGDLATVTAQADAARDEQAAKIAEQEGQIAELTEILQQSTEKLQQATAALTNLRAEASIAVPSPPPLTEEAIRNLQAQVTTPVIEVENGRGGEEIRIYTFPELVSPEGELLGSDLKFSRQYGSKLAFRSSSGQPVSFDVAALHPGILTHLGIDPYDAQRAQSELEEKQARRKEAARLRQIARLKAEAEQAELARELRKETFERQTQLARLENERTRAEAAMKQADAAMIEAHKPPTTLVNSGGFGTGFGFQTIVVPAAPTANGPMAPQSVGQRAPSGIQNSTTPAAQPAPVFTQPSRQPRLPGQLKTGQ